MTSAGQKLLFCEHTPSSGVVLTGPEEVASPVEAPPIPTEPEDDVESLKPLEETPGYDIPDDQDQDADDSTPDRWEVFKGEDGQFYFRRLAGNNEVVAQSEGYLKRRDAVEEAERQAAEVRGAEVRIV